MAEHHVVLNYHLNLNHRALQPEQRERYLASELAELLESIEVPATVSACTEDLLIIKDEAVAAWEVLTTNEQIKVGPSFYSHSLTEQFPADAARSVKAAYDILRTVLPSDKISNYGFPPELSVPTPSVAAAMTSIWHGTVYWDHRSNCSVGDTQQGWFIDLNGLRHVIAIRDSRYRQSLHSYLREFSDAEDVVAALRLDAETTKPASPFVARIDLETPGLNEVNGSGITKKPRIDLFARMQKQFGISSVHFMHLDDCSGIQPVENLPILLPTPAETAVRRWRNPELEQQIKSLSQPEGDYQEMLYLSSLCSDYFMPPEQDMILPARQAGLQGEIRIIADGVARRYELGRKLSALMVGSTLGEILTPHDDPFLVATHNAICEATNLLKQ